MIILVILYAVLASTFFFANGAMAYSKPFFFIGIRMIFAGTMLISYLALFKRKQLSIEKKDILLFLKVSLTHVYIAFMCEFWALSYPSINSSKANLIFSSTPFITALLSYFLLKEKLTVRELIGMIVGILGIVPIMMLKSIESEVFKVSFPELILLLAVISAAYAWFDVKKLMSSGYSLILVNGFAMLFGGSGALLTSYIYEGFTPLPVSNIELFIKYIFVLVLLSNIIFYNLYGWLLQQYRFTSIAFAGCLTPIFGIIFGKFLGNEIITINHFLSIGFITIALYLFYGKDLFNRRKKIVQKIHISEPPRSAKSLRD